ncbi:C2 calcium-dependent domain-containing protein 4C-like [Gadus chalcogrammus]|uniref:C2 calcium-dependent domain-containing protein 4C-like n=1 Tax=Gadus chalcogrammus TaxID=1042646 RepID=UPI0024C483EF|nr:C2 calcium-dependent domain-containing protein 4C-like [Gadus chalcogrammus]XP_056464411.1 C2 calcium-dependent domain-containing protein 4C-like [Gadus chalcogrammus]
MWVLEQIRESVDENHFTLPVEYSLRLAEAMFGERTAQAKRPKHTLCPNIITPSTIPKFFIPPKITPQQEPSKAPDWSKPFPVVKGTVNGIMVEDAAPAREPFKTHVIQVENVDELPRAFSDEGSTNADPRSQAALSLPHLAKAQTCYGFCTLLESPHTRRKESLFHSDPAACGLTLLPPRSPSAGSSPKPPHCAAFSLNKLASRLPTHRAMALHRQVVSLDSDTTSSTESSPFNSPLLARPPPRSYLLKALGHERLVSRAGRKSLLSRNNSLSTDEGSSTDSSPNVVRRSSDEPEEPLTPANVFGLAPPPVFPTDGVLCRERVMREHLVPVGREGNLRLAAEYCPQNHRFRVRLISAEGLYAVSTDPKSINCSISVCLLPGKMQKQRSTVIKRSRNPIFNEDFFFDGICEEHLGNWFLRFKVVNKMSTMKRDYILGDCEILLPSILSG